MKAFLHKIASISMATLVLISTMSFTIDMHHCGDTLVDFSVFHNALTCGMEKQPQPHTDCESKIAANSCCTDSQIVVEGHDDIKMSFDQLSIEQQAFVTTFFYTYVNLFEDLDQRIVPFRDYTPPFLIRDIQKLNDTYLI